MRREVFQPELHIGLQKKPYAECAWCPLKDAVFVPPSLPQEQTPLDILIVGEAPGAAEAKEGQPFVGRSGQLLREVLKETGLSEFSIGITNAVLCHPTDARGYNRTPSRIEIECCRRRLWDEVLTCRPKVVLILGNVALRSLLKKNGINRFRGADLWLEEFGCYAVATLHPASILYNPDQKSQWAKEISRVRNLLTTTRQETNYVVVKDWETFLTVAERLKESPVIAFDIETNNVLSPFAEDGVVTAISFSIQKGTAFTIPLLYQPPAYTKDEVTALCLAKEAELRQAGVRGVKRLVAAYRQQLLKERKPERYFTDAELDRIIAFLRELFTDREKVFVAHNGKFDVQWLWKKFRIPARVDFDTKVAHFVLDENLEHGLKFLAMVHTDMGEYASQMLHEDFPFLSADPETFFTYSCADADATYRLFTVFSKRLEEEGLEKVFRMVMSFQHSTTLLEYTGVRIDQVYLQELKRSLEEELHTIHQELLNRHEIKQWMATRGEPFSPLSHHHVADLLYNCLGLVPTKTTKKGQNSVDRSTIERLAEQHPVAGIILRYRQVHKILTSFLEKFASHIQPDGKIHAVFNVTGTKTGRLSSSDPNMQNIPEHRAKDIKKLIIPSYEPGYIVNFDYSQIELRVLASLADDPTMIAAFCQGADIHTTTAQLIFHKEEVSKEERNYAKRINFGIVYGMSAVGLAEQLGISVEEAQHFIDRYLETYPGVRRYIQRQKKLIHTYGYVESPLGRRRRIPKVFSGDGASRGEAEREAINAPIQSTASDITQLALCRIYQELSKRSLRARPILTVHDSIVLEVHEDDLHEVVPLVKSIMEHPPVDFLKVPLQVDVEYGRNYGEMQPWEEREGNA
ncbi:DNA polymerase [Candidatus Caldatribacterium sp.]|uniref:DNA polymerase n=1 Tax=Candidatus Caldatribacterium sp. TaxID=2282143 RepID=UPI00383C5634|nr:DNA polymerase [Candidatus Caldatribacterium sp.]